MHPDLPIRQFAEAEVTGVLTILRTSRSQEVGVQRNMVSDAVLQRFRRDHDVRPGRCIAISNTFVTSQRLRHGGRQSDRPYHPAIAGHRRALEKRDMNHHEAGDMPSRLRIILQCKARSFRRLHDPDAVHRRPRISVKRGRAAYRNNKNRKHRQPQRDHVKEGSSYPMDLRGTRRAPF